MESLYVKGPTVTVDFLIDAKSGVPFYRQVIEQAKSAIACGSLQPGDRLPTVCQLAVNLAISPNTVSHAYRALEIEGVVDTERGSGTFISHHSPYANRIERQRILDEILAELLARASVYGFSLDDVLEGLRQRKETTRHEASRLRSCARRVRNSPSMRLPTRCVRIPGLLR